MIKAAISITRKINLLTTLLPFTKKPRKSIVAINRGSAKRNIIIAKYNF